MSTNPPHLRPPLTSVYRFLRHYARVQKRQRKQVFCLQIGANDGKSNDPVYPYFADYGWRGLLVEPQKDVFDQGLTQTYAGNDRVILENVALGTSEGWQPFYRVSFSKARWATGLSSFNRKSLEDHIDNGYILRRAQEEGIPVPANQADWIEETAVQTATVSGLLQKHNINDVDVICIDTEGYDYELLKLIDLKRLAPQVIFFESKNLSDTDFVAAQSMLTGLGYRLFWEDGDTLAIRFPYPAIKRWWHWARAANKARRRNARKARENKLSSA